MYSNNECNLNPTSFWTRGLAPKLNEYRNAGGVILGGNCIVGSHSSTVDRLYAWEKKLFQEVKVCIHFYYFISLIKFQSLNN